MLFTGALPLVFLKLCFLGTNNIINKIVWGLLGKHPSHVSRIMQNVRRKLDVEHGISCNNVSSVSESGETLFAECFEKNDVLNRVVVVEP